MPRNLTADERLWCLEQAIDLIKEVGHGGHNNIQDAAGALQNLYQTLCLLRQATLGNDT